MITHRHIIGAALWAPALVNGDYSSLDAGEACAMAQWLARELGEHEAIVDCGEPYFSWNYGLHTGERDCLGGDVVAYTVANLKEENTR